MVSVLNKHTILVVVAKAERAIPMQSVLTKLGCKTIVSSSVFDAIQCLNREMPHMIVTESLMSDGNAGLLYDKVKGDPLFAQTPMMVLINKKSREELESLSGRSFAGFLLGAFQAGAFATKVLEILNKLGQVSPYFISAESAGLISEVEVRVEASVLGVRGDFLVIRSKSHVDDLATLACVPQDNRKAAIELSRGSNLELGDDYLNLFPLRSIEGKGRDWLQKLPNLEPASEKGARRSTKIVFFDPNASVFAQFRQLLSGYSLELVHADSAKTLITMLSRGLDQIGAIFMHQFPVESDGGSWRTLFEKIPKGKRPPLLIAAADHGFRPLVDARYLHKPFGVGVLVETLESAMLRSTNFMKTESAAGAESGSIPVAYLAQAKLLGLDEMGGLLETDFPLTSGARLNLNHPTLKEVLPANANVSIVGSEVSPDNANKWRVRFEAVSAGTSKQKYWEKIAKRFDTKKIQVA